ncbi:hypothetical protein GC174_15765 [bacterium]|nr:hypothetical protein [bacterium]
MHRPKDKHKLKQIEAIRKESCRRHRRTWSGGSDQSLPVTFKARVEDAGHHGRDQLNRTIADLQEVI